MALVDRYLPEPSTQGSVIFKQSPGNVYKREKGVISYRTVY